MQIEWQQEPNAIDPSKPILKPLPSERQQELDALSWIGYLNSPEWSSIRAFALSAFPVSQVTGEGGNLETHHNAWRPRGAERPRDLLVCTADEHRRIHGTIPRDELISLLLIEETDPRWVSTLQEYRRTVAQGEPAGLRGG